jgi:hypothetical protein
MDICTKYAITIPVKSQGEIATADALFYHVFMTHGFPEMLLSDKGAAFMSAVVTRLLRLCQIHKMHTSPYNPQANGANEGSHKFLMSVIKIIIEKNPSEFANAALIATFNWNISSTEELASVSPFELMYGQPPRLPYSVSVLFADAQKFQEVDASNYENYADYLDAQLSRSQEAFLEARYNAGIARLHRGNFKFADVTKITWLQPGKLVIVYAPPRSGAVSAKLLYRFKGPYRIVKQIRGALLLENLDGTPADTQNIRNCYQYYRQNDGIIQEVSDTQLVKDDLHDYTKDDCVILDMTDDGGKPTFRVIRITSVLGNGNYEVQFYETYSKAKCVAKREYLPAYNDAQGYEVYTNSPAASMTAMVTMANEKEFRFLPFALTLKGNIPNNIVKEMIRDDYVVMLLSFS